MIAIPLPWMIGSMVTVTVGAMLKLPLALPNRLRSVMVVVLGIMLGSGFTPAILPQLGDWALSLSTLVLYVIVSGAIGIWYFRKLCDYGPITSYFSAMPGGLSEMTVVGGEMGGDSRKISLTHAWRILTVIMTLPFLFQLWLAYDPATRPSVGLPMTEVPLEDMALLTACAVAGYFIAKGLRIPAAAIVGPMILSAAVHLAGWTTANPPSELIAVAQVVVGAAIGCRFVGISLAFIGRSIVAATGGTVILAAISLLFAWVLHNVTGLSFAALFLAFAPGGLAEMSLIALSLSLDSAFVATHHIVRIFIIVVCAPLLFKILQQLWGDPRSEQAE
ncbi:AbrB family transcriptional regulator [Denitrobaculum tricleocarpae]|uniref:AbrB family transcriptional regulator n=2 Tax=Denitrobaculum tricleocarpae TaxID=2591009 RepID=A0A545TQ80_9PROT|nr:AbrB family transcriptional regulator [Denitrobaculum tricleocarpae]